MWVMFNCDLYKYIVISLYIDVMGNEQSVPHDKHHVSKSCDETTIISKLVLFQVVNLNKSYISHFEKSIIS